MSPAVRRRTQGERSQAMRARLLDATIDCLYELGYAGTTTTVVCDRAGVSRGAQLHHFPTRADLVTEAVARLFARQAEEFRVAFAEVPVGPERPARAVDLLWSMVSGKSFYAWLELVVASRTDDTLRVAVARITADLAEIVRAHYRALFPDRIAQGPIAELAPLATFALMQGLALDLIVLPDHTETTRVLDGWRQLARLTLITAKKEI